MNSVFLVQVDSCSGDVRPLGRWHGGFPGHLSDVSVRLVHVLPRSLLNVCATITRRLSTEAQREAVSSCAGRVHDILHVLW